MSRDEEQDPADGGCGPTGTRLAAFLAGEFSRSQQQALRGHLAGCPACRQSFEEAVGLAAHLNRKPRHAREQGARHQRRHRQRARALSAAFRLPGGDRGARLRLLLLPAFVIFLLTVVARGPRSADAARLSAVSGSVHLGQDPLPGEVEAFEVVRGQLCSTGPDGRARLDAAGGSAELGPDTWLWLEDHEGPRLRLGGGELVARGRTTLTSRAGVVELHGGAARVRLASDGELEVEALEGEATLADSRGDRRIRAGQLARAGGPGVEQGHQPQRFPPR